MKKLILALFLIFITKLCLAQVDVGTNNLLFKTNGSGEDKKEDLSKYNFYNDYLADLQKTSFIHSDIADTLAVKRNDMETIIISSVKAGIGPLFEIVSVGIDIPIYYRFNVSAEFGSATSLIEYSRTSFHYGFGLGYIAVRTRNDKFILKLNSYICKGLNTDNYKVNDKENFAFHIGSDILFKMHKHIYISINIASFVVPNYQKHNINALPHISLGLNGVF